MDYIKKNHFKIEMSDLFKFHKKNGNKGIREMKMTTIACKSVELEEFKRVSKLYELILRHNQFSTLLKKKS